MDATQNLIEGILIMLAIISLAVLLRKATILNKEDSLFSARLFCKLPCRLLFSFEEIRYEMQIINILS